MLGKKSEIALAAITEAIKTQLEWRDMIVDMMTNPMDETTSDGYEEVLSLYRNSRKEIIEAIEANLFIDDVVAGHITMLKINERKKFLDSLKSS